MNKKHTYYASNRFDLSRISCVQCSPCRRSLNTEFAICDIFIICRKLTICCVVRRVWDFIVLNAISYLKLSLFLCECSASPVAYKLNDNKRDKNDVAINEIEDKKKPLKLIQIFCNGFPLFGVTLQIFMKNCQLLLNSYQFPNSCG